MNPSTKKNHRRLQALGEALGFTVGMEVSNSLLRVRLDADVAYRPRLDLLWSLPLTPAQRDGLAWLLRENVADVTHLPVVGIEAELSNPTTKTMQADVANICALGAPSGLLVVTKCDGENIYRRAARVIRSMRRSFGDLRVLPMEVAWLPVLLKQKWPSGLAPAPNMEDKRPAGGEHPEWCVPTRRELRKRGEDAGFVVVEPFRPPVVPRTFDHASVNWKKPLQETIESIKGRRADLKSADKYFTDCKIDMAWLMPLPNAFAAFLSKLAQKRSVPAPARHVVPQPLDPCRNRRDRA